MSNTKRLAKFLAVILSLLCLLGCGNQAYAPIAATTAPVWQFASELCQGTPLQVTRLINQSVSCLHDYTLTVDQMKVLENAELIVISGAGLEDFMEDILEHRQVLDASQAVPLLEANGDHHHEEHSGHDHEHDPHIWLSPKNAKIMAQNICVGLSQQYPEYAPIFQANLEDLTTQLDRLDQYAEESLASVHRRDIVTFHDGFSYLAQSYGLHILKAIEEEAGSEASAQMLIEVIQTVEQHDLPAVFTERSGSVSSADIICAETGIDQYCLDMAMASDDYFESMYHNIDTLKEALQP